MNTGLYLTLRYALTVCALLACWAGSVDRADAAGPVGYRDCALSWNPNPEADLAGYRVYLGRNPDQLTRMRDVGLRTAFRCSEGDAAENGQWFGTVTAYDHSGNESDPAQAVPFEIAGWPDPVPPAQLFEPSSTRLVNTTNGLILFWADMNTPQVSHRVEISSSLHPAWTRAIVQPPGLTRFSFYALSEADWVCYRVRGERGTVVSEWAQAGGPEDRQHCLKPERVHTIDNPILSSTILYEPASVRVEPVPLAAAQPYVGVSLTWKEHAFWSPGHRIEISSSTEPLWTTLAVLPPSISRYSYLRPIDAEWACLRIRAEVGRAVSLWAAAAGPNDRQFCFKPSSALGNTPP